MPDYQNSALNVTSQSGKEVSRVDGFKPADIRTAIVQHTASGDTVVPVAEGTVAGQKEVRTLICPFDILLFTVLNLEK